MIIRVLSYKMYPLSRISEYAMSATEELRADHVQVRRLEKILFKCVEELKKGEDIPFSDLTKITIIISEFIDIIHHSREEAVLTIRALRLKKGASNI